MERAAAYITGHTAALGVRAPNARGRARAVGLAIFARGLGLSEKELCDALGLSFDKDAVFARIAHLLVADLVDDGRPREDQAFRGRSPPQFRELHRALVAELARAGVRVEAGPFEIGRAHV